MIFNKWETVTVSALYDLNAIHVCVPRLIVELLNWFDLKKNCLQPESNKKEPVGQRKTPPAHILGGVQVKIKYYRYGEYKYNLQICNQEMI